MCPRERFSSYKTLFRLVPCYKRDWATCCTVATTCYLLLFACNVSPCYTITCYRYFQCLQLLPCWNPFIRDFCSSLGSTLLLIERTTIDPLYLWVINYANRAITMTSDQGVKNMEKQELTLGTESISLSQNIYKRHAKHPKFDKIIAWNHQNIDTLETYQASPSLTPSRPRAGKW